MADPVEQARHGYAEELRFTARVSSPAVVNAFAAVPRERFVGPGPWRVKSPMNMAEYWTTEDADPRHVYHFDCRGRGIFLEPMAMASAGNRHDMTGPG
jgi:protein-L-isoaspartate(D-aspartate) O-methyltransferase